MPIDKNNLDLQLLDDLTMMVLEAKFGSDPSRGCGHSYHDVHTGEERLTYDGETYYQLAFDLLTDLLTQWLEARDQAPDSPHQLNPKKK